MKNPFVKNKVITSTPSSRITGLLNLPSSALYGSTGWTSTSIYNNTSIWSSTAHSFDWTPETPEQITTRRKKELSDEFEKNPELFSEIIVELRKRKIQKIMNNV